MKILKLLKALDDPSRIKMIYILSDHKFCQVHLEKLVGISQTNISRNLKELVDAEVLGYEMTERKNRYFVTEKFKVEYSQIHSKIMEDFADSTLENDLQNMENECEKLNTH